MNGSVVKEGMRLLPRGILLNHGYVQIRVFKDGTPYYENFGRDCPLARQMASIKLAEIRKAMLLGTFDATLGVKQATERRRFKDVAQLYVRLWSREKNDDGTPKHTADAVRVAETIILSVLVPAFGHLWFDAVRPLDIQRWREKQIAAGLKGSTVNRRQVVLSSMYSHCTAWRALEKILPFAMPTENPCKHVKKAREYKRERLVTHYEIAKLINAARELSDHAGAANIQLAVKTCLSCKDLQKLRFGDGVCLQRAKTGVEVRLPGITVLHVPDWRNWRKRWGAIRLKAGLPDVEMRDLRKAGGNLGLKQRHPIESVSMYMGHASVRTTENWYHLREQEAMAAIAADLSAIVDQM